MSENAEVLRRFVSLELSGAEGRILEGLCAPYNAPAKVKDPGRPPYVEVFAPGAFRRACRAAHKVQLTFEHRDGLTDRLGKALELEEQDGGLWGRFQVASGPIGDHALALVDEGVIAGLSVGFVPHTSKRNSAGEVVRVRCSLPEVALVPEPAYAGTEVVHRSANREAYAIPLAPDPEQLARLAAIGVVPVTQLGDGPPAASV